AEEDYKSEKRCQRTSFAFYQAVRDRLPVWVLEDMRTMEVFHWEEDGRACAYTPSEALLYALVHDHQQYARHLLSRHSLRALDMPSRSFRCCPASPTPHVAVAVRYNRVRILRMILGCATDFTRGERQDYLDRRGCTHGDSALHLACDLLRPECLVLLLGHGASPYVTDRAGNTPLDGLLADMRRGAPDMAPRRVCLGYLLLFMPELRFRLRGELRDDAPRWQELLGRQAFQWLCGRTPPSLFAQAMQTLTRCAPPATMDTLPGYLRPLDFRLHQERSGNELHFTF
uniref:Ankyrin repeat domain 9 n=1 Tax=Denticeps clupeoides TaxID=299321 RepID=A0AAY4BLL4_9TELE